MEDEAEIYEGIRAQFPLTFGKQSGSQTSLEAVHNATRRRDDKPSRAHSSTPDKGSDLPSLSSSSQAWLNSLRPRNSNPNPSSGINSTSREDSTAAEPADSDAGDVIGPPRPPAELGSDDDDGVMVGPLPPPPNSALDDDEDDNIMIGPPPPQGLQSDDDEEEEENRYRIPFSNEIVLKGHSKVPHKKYSVIILNIARSVGSGSFLIVQKEPDFEMTYVKASTNNFISFSIAF